MLLKQRPSAPLRATVERTSGARITTPGCPNVSSMILRAQRGYRARNKKYEREDETERQPFNTARRRAPSKGTDLVDNDDGMDGKRTVRVVARLVERERKRSRIFW